MTLVCSRAGASRRRRPHEDCRRQGNRSVRAAGRGVAGHGKKIQGAGRRSRDRARRGHQIGAVGFGIHLRRRNRQRRCPQRCRHHHQGETPGGIRACQLQARHPGHCDHGSLRQRGRAEDAGRGRHFGICDGTDAAHHPRAGDGCAVQPSQSRRLSRRDRGSRDLRPRFPDDDDRGRHDSGSQSVRDGCRRCRPAGDRHRAAARRCRHRDRRAARDQGAG